MPEIKKLTANEKIKKVIEILESPYSNKYVRERSLKILKIGEKPEQINIKEAKELLDYALSFGINRFEISKKTGMSEVNLSRIFHARVTTISKKTIQPLINFVETLKIGERKNISHENFYKFGKKENT